MAVAFDAYSEGGGQNAHTYSHTSTGSGLVMMIGVMSNHATDPTVTYNGDALTKVGSTQNMDGSRYITFWILVNPDTGTNTVSVTPAGSGNYAWSCTATATGADGTQPDAEAKNVDNSLGTTWSNTVTSTVDNCLHFAFFTASTEADVAAGASTTLLGSHTSFYGGFGMFVGSSVIATAGSSTLNFTCSNSIRGSAGVTIAPLLATIVTPSALAITSAVLAPSVSGSANVSPSALAVTSALLAPSLKTDDSFAPSAQALTLTLQTPVILAGRTVAPSALAITASIQTPSLSLGWSVSVSAVSITSATLTPTFMFGVTIMPDPLELTLTMGTIASRWNNRTKPSSSWTDRTQLSSIWTDRTPPTTPWS